MNWIAILRPACMLALAVATLVVPARAEDAAIAARKAEIARISKETPLECRLTRSRAVECESFGYEIEVRGCGRDAFYAGISESAGVRLDDRIAPENAKGVAVLSDKQFVCVGATAKDGARERYYVVAVSVERLAACRGKNICKVYGDRPVKWLQPLSGVPCRLEQGRYLGDCAAGWVDKSVLDEFSNGL